MRSTYFVSDARLIGAMLCGFHCAISIVQIYARLIGLAIFYALSAPYRWAFNRELSLPKAFSSFQAVIPSLIRVIRKGWRAFPSLLKYLTVHWRRFDLKTHRRKSPSTLQLLLNAA